MDVKAYSIEEVGACVDSLLPILKQSNNGHFPLDNS
jgi:hypothetical protein